MKLIHRNGIMHGAEPNIIDNHHSTPLLEASLNRYPNSDDYLNIVKLLLQHGADPEFKLDSQGKTADSIFYVALSTNRSAIAALFFEYGATPYNPSNGTPTQETSQLLRRYITIHHKLDGLIDRYKNDSNKKNVYIPIMPLIRGGNITMLNKIYHIAQQKNLLNLFPEPYNCTSEDVYKKEICKTIVWIPHIIMKYIEQDYYDASTITTCYLHSKIEDVEQCHTIGKFLNRPEVRISILKALSEKEMTKHLIKNEQHQNVHFAFK